MSRPSRHHAGFTVVELLLVLAIVAVVALLAIPRFQAATDRFRADSAARRVVADVALVRARARALCASQTLSFIQGAGSDSYTVFGMADPDRPSSSYKVRLSNEPYRATIVSATFGTSGNTNTVTFNGYGMPNTGGSVILAVGSNRRTVTIDAASGEVTVQ